MLRFIRIATLIGLVTGGVPAVAQAPIPSAPPAAALGASGARTARPGPPLRDPHTDGYVQAKELSDGSVPPPNQDGNFIIGPTHPDAPEMLSSNSTPHGTVFHFTMESTESKFYPGIMKGPAPGAAPPAPSPGGGRGVTTSHPAPYTRKVAVYVPKQYVPGTAAPFLVGADGDAQPWNADADLFTVLDNLIAAHKVPAMIAITIG